MDEACKNPDCTTHDHFDADERWCEPHGVWAIGNPCEVMPCGHAEVNLSVLGHCRACDFE